MNTRFRLFLILVGAILVVTTFSFPFWQPLFENEVVNEVFPGLPVNLQTAFQALPAEQQAAFLAMAEEDSQMAIAMLTAAVSDATIAGDEEQVIPPSSVVAAAGEFTRVDILHWAEGTATIYLMPDNTKMLRLENFRAANGPDLRVILSASEEPRTSEEVALHSLYLELGRLKGNIGNQNYTIPPEVDLEQYNSVVIYCRAFGIVFSTASI